MGLIQRVGLEEYKAIVKNTSEFTSHEWLELIASKSEISWSSKYFLGVENIKYHNFKKGYKHITYFFKPLGSHSKTAQLLELDLLRTNRHRGWFVYENPTERKTVKLRHVHMVNNYEIWLKHISNGRID